MKTFFFLVISLFYFPAGLFSQNEVSSLLNKLDRIIIDQAVYTTDKESEITQLKQKRLHAKSLEERYQINKEIIEHHETFICDSAQTYITENLDLARQIGNIGFLNESRLHLAFVYSLSGLFMQATEVLQQINYEELPLHLKIFYCFSSIRFHENLIKYTDNPALSVDYIKTENAYRDTVMSLLDENSDDYWKEKAHKFQQSGNYKDAIDIQTQLFEKQQPDTHDYAMLAMGLARVYKQAGNPLLEEKYLILAAMTDIKLAVKENEALLTLAINYMKRGISTVPIII